MRTSFHICCHHLKSQASGEEMMKRKHSFLCVVTLICASYIMIATPVWGQTTYCNPPDSNRFAVISLPAFNVQVGEWGSMAHYCVTASGTGAFSIGTSEVNNDPSMPAAYSAIYMGCHWSTCSPQNAFATGPYPTGTLTVQADNPYSQHPLGPYDLTSGIDTTQSATGVWQTMYDIWFNTTDTIPSGQPAGLELIVILNRNPVLTTCAAPMHTNYPVGGINYDVSGCLGDPANGTPNKLFYVMDTPVNSITSINLVSLFRDAISEGYLDPNWYLVSIESGFEVYSGGQGLYVNGFGINYCATGYPNCYLYT
jgi:hypothetical protein